MFLLVGLVENELLAVFIISFMINQDFYQYKRKFSREVTKVGPFIVLLSMQLSDHTMLISVY